MAALDYAQSGVNRKAADQFVEKIAALSKKTLNRRVKASIGGYASLFELDRKRWLAASTDGVGTKLKLAFSTNRHDTIGIDLVAMSVNDLLCVGAEPLFFLDYFATGRLDEGVGAQVLQGIVEGCSQAGCALVGGETAEMPGFYADGEYDLGGFAVGSVEPSRVLPRPAKEIRAGDVLIGIRSSGCHSNGYSLLRKLLAESAPAARPALEAELLTPTRIYVKALKPLIADRKVKGLAHITGSGFLNVPRISDKFSYALTLPPSPELPRIYDWVRQASGLPFAELAQTFNMGVGMVAVVSPRHEAAVLKALKRAGEKAWTIGEVTRRARGRGSQVILGDGGENSLAGADERVVLDYS